MTDPTGDFTLAIPGDPPFLLKSVEYVEGMVVWIFSREGRYFVWDYAGAWHVLQRCKLDYPEATLAKVLHDGQQKG